MDDDSECDWCPPAEVDFVESEIFQIPSGLPSLEEFIRTELEIEAAARIKAEAEVEAEGDIHDEALITTSALAEVDSFIKQPADEDEPNIAPTYEVHSEDDIDMPAVDVRKAKKPQKITADEWYVVDTVKIDLGDSKHKVAKQAKEELKLRLVSSTHNYIDDLITKVVEICEYEDPNEILRARLNKDALFKELDDKMLQLDIEQKIRFFLNRKAVEYFRRKKATRPLMEDSPDDIINELRKYREGLLMVNNFKGRQEATRILMETKIDDLRKQVKNLEAKALQESMEFVNLVKKVFSMDGSDKMNALIDSMMNKVAHMHREISKLRFVLIQRQHNMATLQDRAKKLEDLGNGLRMIDFEHLQTETQALGKKIEERNNELNRLHDRCNADIHTLAHYREKKHMIRNTIAAQQSAYDELVSEKQDCREYLNSLKMDRGFIRREFQRISFQGGLLDKPELLLDYDATVEKATDLRATVTEMKTQQLVVANKLKHMMRLLQ